MKIRNQKFSQPQQNEISPRACFSLPNCKLRINHYNTYMILYNFHFCWEQLASVLQSTDIRWRKRSWILLYLYFDELEWALSAPVYRSDRFRWGDRHQKGLLLRVLHFFFYYFIILHSSWQDWFLLKEMLNKFSPMTSIRMANSGDISKTKSWKLTITKRKEAALLLAALKIGYGINYNYKSANIK